MKIEIPDELYHKLRALGEELYSQDNLGTAKPILFFLHDVHREYHEDGIYRDVLSEDGESLGDLSDIFDEIVEMSQEEDNVPYQNFVKKLSEENPGERIVSPWLFASTLQEILRRVELGDIDGIIQAHKEGLATYYCDAMGYSVRAYDLVRGAPITLNQPVFLTNKSIEDHINRNSHHYSDPSVYVDQAWRNPDMELIYEFFSELIGKDLKK